MILALNATVTYRAALPSDPTGVAVGVIRREDFDLAWRGRSRGNIVDPGSH